MRESEEREAGIRNREFAQRKELEMMIELRVKSTQTLEMALSRRLDEMMILAQLELRYVGERVVLPQIIVCIVGTLLRIIYHGIVVAVPH